MSATMSLLFFARKSKANRNGEAPIYMRITIGGQRLDMGTKRFVPLNIWLADAGKAKGNTEGVRTINAYLDALRAKAFDHQRQILLEGKDLTMHEFKSRWLGLPKRKDKQNERPHLILEVFASHNEQMKALVGREFAPLTLERYVTSKKHTEEFIKWKYKADDMDIKDLDFEFITSYEFWLKSVRKCEHNTAIKYLSNFRKIINICLKNGWLLRNPFMGFKMTKRDTNPSCLTQAELDALSEKVFRTQRVNQVRDIFLFCCYTGLAYADVKKLNASHIGIGIDGRKWIFTQRTKTDSETRVPLLAPALALLDKYRDHPECVSRGRLMPVLSNQKMNAYLGEIADLCHIDKKMTTHTARHTFATTVLLSNDVPIETVSKLLGHKNLKYTQHYARVHDRKVSIDMLKLNQVLSDKSAPVVALGINS
jgi:site-specific recombinase XerD